MQDDHTLGMQEGMWYSPSSSFYSSSASSPTPITEVNWKFKQLHGDVLWNYTISLSGVDNVKLTTNTSLFDVHIGFNSSNQDKLCHGGRFNTTYF